MSCASFRRHSNRCSIPTLLHHHPPTHVVAPPPVARHLCLWQAQGEGEEAPAVMNSSTTPRSMAPSSTASSSLSRVTASSLTLDAPPLDLVVRHHGRRSSGEHKVRMTRHLCQAQGGAVSAIDLLCRGLRGTLTSPLLHSSCLAPPLPRLPPAPPRRPTPAPPRCRGSPAWRSYKS
jgi:hypothetical protein